MTNPVSIFEDLASFLGYKYLHSLMRIQIRDPGSWQPWIRDPGWEKSDPGSGIKQSLDKISLRCVMRAESGNTLTLPCFAGTLCVLQSESASKLTLVFYRDRKHIYFAVFCRQGPEDFEDFPSIFRKYIAFR